MFVAVGHGRIVPTGAGSFGCGRLRFLTIIWRGRSFRVRTLLVRAGNKGGGRRGRRTKAEVVQAVLRRAKTDATERFGIGGRERDGHLVKAVTLVEIRGLREDGDGTIT